MSRSSAGNPIQPCTKSLLEIIVTSLSNLFYPGSQRIIDPIGDPLGTDGVLLFHPGHDQPWADPGILEREACIGPPPRCEPQRREAWKGGGGLGVLTRLFIYFYVFKLNYLLCFYLLLYFICYTIFYICYFLYLFIFY